MNEAMQGDNAGIFALLEFLTGSSMRELARQHGLTSPEEAEELIRQVLLRHGYSAANAAGKRKYDPRRDAASL